MALDLTTSTGLERVGREALLILFNNLNTEIAAQNTTWAARDTQFFSDLGRTNPGWTVETIPNSNFYHGHVPSLLEAPVDKYPNCSVLAYIAEPQRTSDDWGEHYVLALYVELMCKSLLSEEEVNARIQRTTDAVKTVFSKGDNRTLNGLVTEIGNTPKVRLGDVFVRREEKARGNRWFWQGARLDFSIQKYAGY